MLGQILHYSKHAEDKMYLTGIEKSLIYHFQTNGVIHETICNKIRMINSIYCGVTGYNIQNIFVFVSFKINFVVANSADPDEMSHNG